MKTIARILLQVLLLLFIGGVAVGRIVEPLNLYAFGVLAASIVFTLTDILLPIKDKDE